VKHGRSKKKHILLISTNPRILAEMKMELMDHFDISISSANDTALAALEMYELSAILIYIGENREKSFSVFSSILEPVKDKKIPIIFLAEKGSDDDESTAFAMGAADYSARRPGTTNALISRINLRISASEYERRIMDEGDSALSGGSVPEEVLIDKTIIVADDLEINREIIAAMLSCIKGLTLEFAADGREVVEKFEKNPNLYAFIIMDVQMPEMDGLAATKAIRRLDCENARKIPIIAMTAGTSEDEIALCHEAGMDDIVEKPADYDKLIAVVSKHCL